MVYTNLVVNIMGNRQVYLQGTAILPLSMKTAMNGRSLVFVHAHSRPFAAIFSFIDMGNRPYHLLRKDEL